MEDRSMNFVITIRIAALLCAALLTFPTSTVHGADGPTWADTKLRTTEGKALFEEKCRTVAGEKIYKTIRDVEGLLLLKIRPEHAEGQEADLLWPGAAFALEARTDEYIKTFLGYEIGAGDPKTGIPTPITPKDRGYIVPDQRPGARPGYRWVEVLDEKDGKRYRYSGSEKVVGKKDVTAKGVQMAMARDPNYDLNVYRWTLDKVPAPGASPRYGVTFEDYVVPEERRRGLASSTVKVIDLKTGEVLGEMLRYTWSPGAPSSANPRPWLTAYKCPGHAVGSGEATRKFVDQVLIPREEN
jgi:hypothetical protein